MRFIAKDDIERWAPLYSSKGELPIVISKLVRGTSPPDTQIRFPAGSAVFMGGWDGVVISNSETSFVPQGISLWEFGTETQTGSKAKKDFVKRSADTLGYKAEECTYISLTPRNFKGKSKWIAERKKESAWKDVRIYDSVDIEAWIDMVPVAMRYFGTLIRKVQPEGYLLTEEFWDQWTFYERYQLSPKLITIGREIEMGLLQDFLTGKEGIQAVQATSRDEAIAFIIAAAKQFSIHASENFFSKSLVVENVSNFRALIYNESKLNFISRFDDQEVLHSAVPRGHHVLLPLGPDDSSTVKTISLPLNDGNGQIQELVEMGLEHEYAKKISKECGRNNTILKKLLGFPHNKEKWLLGTNILEILPALLIGRWNETFIGDKQIIEQLAGMSYDHYRIILDKWVKFENAPILQIGNTWRLTSPMDAWTTLSRFVLRSDFDKLNLAFKDVYENGNPLIEENYASQYSSLLKTKQYTYSNWIREGVCQSLIIISMYGGNLKVQLNSDPQQWVDKIIAALLAAPSEELWRSFDREMPLLAEASPSAFLEAVRTSLLSSEKHIIGLFKSEPGIISEYNFHTGLLWALEGLCWLPEYLYESSLLLLKLTDMDPGVKVLNRPINSLTEIFKPWHHQTLTEFNERMDVLEGIVKMEDKGGWKLLIRLLPQDHGIAHETSKMRWRMFKMRSTLNYHVDERIKTYSFIVRLLMGLFDNSQEKFCELLNESENLYAHDRAYLLQFLIATADTVKLVDFTAWDIARKIIANHRTHVGTRWAISESGLQPYQLLYDKLSPQQTADKYLWLFNEHWPEFPDVVNTAVSYSARMETHGKELRSARMKAVDEIIEKLGLPQVFVMSRTVKEPRTLGDTLARMQLNDEQDLMIVSQIVLDVADPIFLYSYIFTKSRLFTTEWAQAYIAKFEKSGWPEEALLKIFLPLPESVQLWDFIESKSEGIRTAYWKEVQPNFFGLKAEDKITGANYLLRYRRFNYAAEVASHYFEELPTDLIIEIMHRLATEKSEENGRYHGSHIEHLLEELDKRSDASYDEMVNLEWLYLSTLSSVNSWRTPKRLHNEMATNPDFFIDLLKWVFVSEDEKLADKEHEGVAEEVRKNRALHGYDLLHSWKQIPGMSDNGIIDELFLNSWIHTVRKFAAATGRIEVADMQIGKVLASYPENNPNWPPKSLLAVIEQINTKSIKSNFSAALYNKRGLSSRGLFDGGDIEKNHANYFNKLFQLYKTEFPIVSQIFLNLAKGYMQEAKLMDERAKRDTLEY